MADSRQSRTRHATIPSMHRASRPGHTPRLRYHVYALFQQVETCQFDLTVVKVSSQKVTFLHFPSFNRMIGPAYQFDPGVFFFVRKIGTTYQFDPAFRFLTSYGVTKRPPLYLLWHVFMFTEHHNHTFTYVWTTSRLMERERERDKMWDLLAIPRTDIDLGDPTSVSESSTFGLHAERSRS